MCGESVGVLLRLVARNGNIGFLPTDCFGQHRGDDVGLRVNAAARILFFLCDGVQQRELGRHLAERAKRFPV
jgi:hypothetical protein